jgi:hypothetical protein
MSKTGRRKAEGNAGAFLGTDGISILAVPMRTLSDEYHDSPAEPEDSDRVPAPEPPSLARRLIDRVEGKPSRGSDRPG